MQRRQFLQLMGGTSVATVAGGAMGAIGVGGLSGCHGAGASSAREGGSDSTGWSVAEIRRGLVSGRLRSAHLTEAYLRRIERIDRRGPRLNAILELNPEALSLARALDEERRGGRTRGPWHGIPVLLKDNIDTGDRMHTSAGSLALAKSKAPRDSLVASRLRAAGAVLLGKTNLSEWANFRGTRSISGWSGRGGQTVNPYCLACNPSGSSSGSAVAVAAGLCAVAVGTETNGSIVSPSAYCGIVGLKPTVGLISRTGIIPISSSQDTAGPMGRTVADVAALLGVLAGVDAQDPATTVPGRDPAPVDYERFLEVRALAGARLGVPRALFRLHRRVDPVFADALALLQKAGAELVESVALPSRQDLGGADFQVMLYEYKEGLNAYFRSLGSGAPVGSLAELITFNERHAEEELKYFGQETLIEAQAKGPLTDPAYRTAKERCREWGDRLGAVLADQRLDAVVAPTAGPAHVTDFVHGDRGMGGTSSYAAVSGFPNITVPCGLVLGLPVGLSFFGPRWSEGRLLALAYAFEQARPSRRAPTYAPTPQDLQT